jgi:hypothetical protein
MLRHACRQCRRARPPSGTHRAAAWALVQRQRLPHPPGRSGHLRAGLEAAHPLAQALAVVPAAGRRTRPRCPGRSHGQVPPCDPGRAERAAALRQACGAPHDARTQRQERALGRLGDPWRRDPIRRGRPARWAGAPPWARARTRRHDVAGREARRQRAGAASAAARRAPPAARRGGGHDRLGRGARARPHDGGAPPPPRGGHAAPAPVPSLRAVGPACPGRVRLPRVLARTAGPPRVALPLGHRQGPPPVAVARGGLVRRTPAPGPHGRCRHATPTVHAGQSHTDPEPLQGPPDGRCRGAAVAKDRRAGRSTGRLPGGAAPEASRAAVGESRRERAHVPTRRAARMSARGMGARLAPRLGGAPRSILRGV